MTAGRNVLIVAEIQRGVATATSLELIGLGRELAGNGGRVDVAVFGTDPGDVSRSLIEHGADRVFVGHGSSLAEWVAVYLPSLENLVRDIEPTLVAFGHTAFGAEVAPRLAFRLGVAIATDCVMAEITDDRLLLTRPCLGGKARETLHCLTMPAVATFKPKSHGVPASDNARVGETIVVDPPTGLADTRVTVVAREPRSYGGQKLQDAEIVVGAGRGLKDKNGFEFARELAAALDGAIGSTRAACDMGLCEYTNQIGASGVTVAPDLYLAIGISGAGHHMVGCANSKNIVAINIDPDAAIFAHARFGVVGDSRAVLPAFLSEVLRIKRERQK